MGKNRRYLKPKKVDDLPRLTRTSWRAKIPKKHKKKDWEKFYARYPSLDPRIEIDQTESENKPNPWAKYNNLEFLLDEMLDDGYIKPHKYARFVGMYTGPMKEVFMEIFGVIYFKYLRWKKKNRRKDEDVQTT